MTIQECYKAIGGNYEDVKKCRDYVKNVENH